MTVDPDKLLQCAIDAARAAGNHALENIKRRTEVIVRTAHDVKLQLDRESQAKAVACIKSRFPEHCILGEEDENRSMTRPACEALWIVDPIDGTVNFSHGLPLWCSSVAVAVGNDSVAGAVYAPVLEKLFTARVGAPAMCNGSPIRVSSVSKLSEAIVMTATDHNDDGRFPPLARLKAISSSVHKTRVMGSAAIDLCHVACGAADGYFEGRIYPWDVAAAGLIVEQAGGRSEILRESPDGVLCYLATNGTIHEDLRKALDGLLP